jgi:SAM-dependent methyltransferase
MKQHAPGAKPLPFIVDALSRLSGGEALDLACGRGRHFGPLSENGFSITGIEKDESHCADLRTQFPNTAIVCLDLEEESLAKRFEYQFDIVVMTFFLWRPLFEDIARVLRPGGHLLLETFHLKNHEVRGKPRRTQLALAPGEAKAIAMAAGLDVQIADEGERGEIYTSRLWATKPSD